ncbi:MAG: hypothetical protein H6812_12970 [Phycisphaeraceae bacterium]|nr:hypothetical protein [Phycisphaerales bacterium]MCB9844149.1 hypothetical protein [Phycisphaeraceae bacterium]
MTTPRAVFRVLIKILGVYFLVIGAHEIIIRGSQMLSQWALYSIQGFGSIGSRSLLEWVVFVLVTFFEFAMGLYLFLVVAWSLISRFQ